MFLRFPELVPGYDKRSTLAFEKIPYALFSVEKNEGKKTVFLTEHTLMFVITGEKRIHLTDKTLFIDDKKIIFLKRGIYAMSEYFPNEENFEVLLIFIPDSFLKEFIYNYQHNSTNQNDQSYLELPSNDLLDSFKNHYKKYFGNTFNNLQFILKIKLQELFLLLTSSNSKIDVFSFVKSLIYDNRIDLEFIVRKYLFHPLTIPELARLSGRSIASFKRDFEHQFGASPRQWINQQRLKQAKLLVNKTSKNINEISFECGYENVSHFIKIFKSEFGKTPASARKKIPND